MINDYPQSDYWYKENSREFLICSVESKEITATNVTMDRNNVPPHTYLPIVWSISQDTNRKKLVYPHTKDFLETDSSYDDTYLNTNFLTNSSNLSSFLSDVIEVNIEIDKISKPLISYNSKSDLFNISFQGKYDGTADPSKRERMGFNLFSYTFYYDGNKMIPRDIRVALTQEEDYTDNDFKNGHLNSDYFIDGNHSYGPNDLLTNTQLLSSGSIGRRPPNYKVKPFHFSKSSDNQPLAFNRQLHNMLRNTDDLKPHLLRYSGGFIAQKNDTPGYDTSKCIRVEFTAQSYSFKENGLFNDGDGEYYNSHKYVLNPTNKTNGRHLSVNNLIPLVGLPPRITPVDGKVGEGFCVFFYHQPSPNSTLKVYGVGSTLGYSPDDMVTLEQGDIFWASGGISLYGFLGVGFDIGGDFCSSEENKKPGWYNGPDNDSDRTPANNVPYSIGIRGGRDINYQILSRSEGITDTEKKKHIHSIIENLNDIKDVSYSVTLSQSCEKVSVSAKLQSDGMTPTQWINLHEFNIRKAIEEKGGRFRLPSSLKAGLSVTTSEKVFNFYLKEFSTSGSKKL